MIAKQDVGNTFLIIPSLPSPMRETQGGRIAYVLILDRLSRPLPRCVRRPLDHVPVTFIHLFTFVTRGLDPRVHLLRMKMDCRVKPGNDDEQMSAECALGTRTAVSVCGRIGTPFRVVSSL
jgi:hypothetical protein